MNKISTFAGVALIASLAACRADVDPPSPASDPSAASAPAAPRSALGRLVDREIREAREKLATENISLKHGVRFDGKGGVDIDGKDPDDRRPEAEITPKGDLLIEGKPVAINGEQRRMLLDYRSHIIGLAESGMEIGVQGADLAAEAMGEAFKGIFSGKSEQEIEKAIEAEASGIKQAAAKLCERLPAVMASQQELAAALPEFKPYATMTQEDVDECMKDTDDATTAEVQTEIRQEIRSAIRESVRGGVRGAVRQDQGDPAAEAAAATAEEEATAGTEAKR